MISVFNANSVDTDQTPHYAASDLSLHCLPVSFLWDARHKWVNGNSVFVDRSFCVFATETEQRLYL